MKDSADLVFHDDIERQSKQCTRMGDEIVAFDDMSAPCCRFFPLFYPTHANITTDNKSGHSHKYQWNSRDHRKMRYPLHLVPGHQDDTTATFHPANFMQRFRLVSYEPFNVTWYICWIGFIANTLWVVNGVYAVWPMPNAAMNNYITYATGALGAFLFIVTGYLGFVEAINHTHDEVRVPSRQPQASNCRQIRRQRSMYGISYSPIGFALDQEDALKDKLAKKIVADGYPLVTDESTGSCVTSSLFDRILKDNGSDLAVTEAKITGRVLDIRLGDHIIRVKIESLSSANKKSLEQSHYIWWTNKPDLHHIGVFNSLVFFICTIIFWIPALAWLPMDVLGSPDLAAEIFWVYVLQIIPSIGFVFVGHMSMAETSGTGSFVIPNLNCIGWWVSLFNTIGGYGFLLCPILYIPVLVGDPGCCDVLAIWGSYFATFWGSCSFWIAGVLQCIEFSTEHPITLRRGTFTKKVI